MTREITARPVDVRLRAAELIEKRGWWQGGSTGPLGQMCGLRACFSAARELIEEGGALPAWQLGPAVTRLGRAALLELEDELIMRGMVGSVSSYNDRPGRTVSEVLALLRHERPTERA